MQIGIIKEQETAQVALIPDVVKRMAEHHSVLVEKEAGASAFFADATYEEAGATLADQESIVSKVDLLVTVLPPPENILKQLKENATVISSFKPFNDPAIAENLAKYPISVFSMDMMPRTTIAQDKDVLSSMASIAGYKAVLTAANIMPRYFPMLSTAAGTIPPAKVLILGAGVAGLQAIATAKRLGAVVEVFDTRSAVKEEVQSLGAKFVEVEGAKDDKDAGGYAVEQTEEYKKKQKDLIYDRITKSDVVITTALLRGKKAPILVTKAMLDVMRPGSVIIDLAAAGGGNCEVTENNQTVTYNNIYVVGNSTLEATVPMHASQLFAKNIFNFLKVMVTENEFDLDFDNQMIKETCLVYQGKQMYGVQETEHANS